MRRELTVAEAAEQMRLSEETVRRWARQQKLRAFKRGDDWRFYEEDLAPTPQTPQAPRRVRSPAELRALLRAPLF